MVLPFTRNTPGRRKCYDSTRKTRPGINSVEVKEVFIMGTHPKTIERTQILSGWKNIAAHLGMGVRTIQRYERTLGLPIRRPAGRSRGAVVATKSELDAWVAASPIRQVFQLSKLTLDSHHADMARIRAKVEEMCALRDQMTELRSELRISMKSLRQTIDGLTGELRAGRWDSPFAAILEDNKRNRELWNWLAADLLGGGRSLTNDNS